MRTYIANIPDNKIVKKINFYYNAIVTMIEYAKDLFIGDGTNRLKAYGQRLSRRSKTVLKICFKAQIVGSE